MYLIIIYIIGLLFSIILTFKTVGFDTLNKSELACINVLIMCSWFTVCIYALEELEAFFRYYQTTQNK